MGQRTHCQKPVALSPNDANPKTKPKDQTQRLRAGAIPTRFSSRRPAPVGHNNVRACVWISGPPALAFIATMPKSHLNSNRTRCGARRWTSFRPGIVLFGRQCVAASVAEAAKAWNGGNYRALAEAQRSTFFVFAVDQGADLRNPNKVCAGEGILWRIGARHAHAPRDFTAEDCRQHYKLESFGGRGHSCSGARCSRRGGRETTR